MKFSDFLLLNEKKLREDDDIETLDDVEDLDEEGSEDEVELDKDILGEDDVITRQDIMDLLDTMDGEEVDEFGEFILDVLSGDELDDDDEAVNEAKFFSKKKAELDREKNQNKADRRLKAKALAKYYRKNKARILAKQKKYRKKVAKNPNLVTRHK